MFLTASSIVLIIIAFGLYFRDKKKIHITLMSLAFAIDLTLVLIIEIQRHAVENVVSQPSPFVVFHASVSTLVLLLYIALAYLGIKMAKLEPSPELSKLTSIHTKCATAFIILRLTNYVTSFYMVS